MQKRWLKYFTLLHILFLFICKSAFPQLTVLNSMTPSQLVQNVLVGSGVSVSNVQYSGSLSSIGSFSTGSSPTNLGLTKGVILSTGDISSSSVYPPGSPVWDFASSTMGTGSDPQLASLIPGYTIYDAVVLQFDFVPMDDTIRFRYVFASEEYPDFVNTSYNDVFGFFISGQNPLGGNYNNKNIALVPGTTLPVTIDNINNVTPSYVQYYVDNEGMNGTTVVYDGFTTVLTAWALVTPCKTYHIKIAIGDAGDSEYDSAVFLEANSFSTNAIVPSVSYSAASLDTTAIEGCTSATVGFKLSNPVSTPLVINYTVGGTAQGGGVDYLSIPSSITVPAGQDSAGFVITPVVDGISEGIETVTISVQGTLCGGLSTVCVYIRDNASVNVSAGNDTSICGGSVNLHASVFSGLMPVSYLWSSGNATTSSISVSPPVTTTYYVTVTDACGSQGTDDVVVHFGSAWLINVSADTVICEGGSATLSVTGCMSCLWSNGVNNNINVVSPLVTTTYGAYIITLCDTVVDSVTVVVEKYPISGFSAENISGCKPLLVNFTNESQNLTQNATFLWDFGDGQTSSAPNPNHLYNTSGIYDVSLTTFNSQYCDNKLTQNNLVDVYPSPDASFYINPSSTYLFDPNIYFIDYSSGHPVSWLWNLGNGDSSFVQNFQYSYADTGKYTVTLIVTNSQGCTDSASSFVTIKPDYALYVPSAFAPWHDGPNNIFRAYGTGISSFNMIIFSRWGQQLFESDNIDDGWDGRICGQKAPPDVYVYKITYQVADYKYYEKYGRVALIR